MVVVAGQCSKVGKTSLVTDLIASLRDFEWTAVKITPHAESGCPVNGPRCNCTSIEHTVFIREESERSASSDTSRFLAAGAKRAFWVQAKMGQLSAALADLAALLQSASHIIVESNAILQFWSPGALIMVLDPANPDFKGSAKQILPLADAFVLRSPLPDSNAPNDAAVNLSDRPIFVQPFGLPLPIGVQDLARQLLNSRQHPSSGAWQGHYKSFRD